MSKLLVYENLMIVSPSLANRIGLNEAIVLQQLHYWVNKSTHIIEGRKWIYNTYNDWQEQFSFWSLSTIKRVFRSLADQGFLLSGNWNKSKMDKTKWYTIDYERLEALELAPNLQKKEEELNERKHIKTKIDPTASEINEPAVKDNLYKEDILDRDLDENDTYTTEYKKIDETFLHRHSIRGQKEKEKAFDHNIEHNPDIQNPLLRNQKTEDVKEIIEFWDANGFGFTNVNAKEQLLSWLDDSSFLQPKEMILKAMNIACANNKRKLNYILGILKNWENESLLTVEEVETDQEKQKPAPKQRKSTESFPTGRDIPRGFELDLTAGEE
ncbi:DnaD domain protein [Neobacillus niacini]|uniref:DnaD domain-containing protein n=1 Tax=Neobacillus niacini TaxID=86668 RepID=UPI0028549178|nr:DnaD domain protein [Neobacillus niacini]MDR6999693.1 DnaD/phage-associated family protein [Neobacillus niacini]